MATTRQNAVHALVHFFRIFIPMTFLMTVFFPVQNVFRRLWWKAWGHNPDENIGFHLDKLDFDHHWHNRAFRADIVMGMAKMFYDNPTQSIAVRMYSDFRFFKYQPYDVWAPIADWNALDRPGKVIIDWYIDVEGLSSGKLDWMLNSSPAFKVWYEEALTKTVLDEESYEALKQKNRDARQTQSDLNP